MDRYIGKLLDNRYEILEKIGSGGMANVYKAVMRGHNGPVPAGTVVAVKVLRREFMHAPDLVRRFKNESKAISLLNHPNIVKVYDVSVNDDLQYIVMEYVDGMTLREYLNERGGKLTSRETVHFISRILKALEHAHANGVVHRDIKPQNIMLLDNGQLRMMDFGIARISRAENQLSGGKAMGSVHYISPEQAKGDETDCTSDIYSVGVILFEMLCGKLPFDAESPISVALQQVEQNPKALRSLNPNVPVGLEQITLHAMAKDPDCRYQNCGEMISDLRRWLADPKTTFPAYAVKQKKAAVPVFSEKKSGGEKNREPLRKRLQSRLTTPLSKLFAVTCGVLAASSLFVLVMFQIYQPLKSAEDIPLPNLVGVDFTAASSNGAYPGIKIKLESEDYNADYDEGQIYRQSPNAGTSVKKGSTVQVWVSAGSKMVNVPNYTNQEAPAV